MSSNSWWGYGRRLTANRVRIGMNTVLLEEILACPRLPSLPAIAAQVIELTSDPNVSIKELAKLIQQDQALAAKILRTVNSSFYGLRERCGTIDKALVLLGLSPVKSLVLGFSLVSALPPTQEDGFDYRGYWRRSLYSGVAARDIATVVRELDPDETFLAALFQDIGMMALHLAVPEQYAPILLESKGNHADLLKVEINELEISHAELGGMLCERWKLPAQLIHPVRFHEKPSAAPTPFVHIARTVALGNLVHNVLTDPTPVDALRTTYRRAHEWFRMEPSEVDEIVHRTSVLSKELGSVLELDTGPSTNATKLLESAQKHLIDLNRNEPNLSSVVSTAGNSPFLSSPVDDLDPLTGLLSAQSLRASLLRSFEESALTGEPMGLAHVELGGFDQVLASNQLDLADEAILLVSMYLKRAFEPIGGFVGRSGDANFMILVPGVTRVVLVKSAEIVLQDLRSALNHMQEQRTWPSTLSIDLCIGVAAWETTSADVLSTPQRVIAASVKASRAAKEAGGNCLRAFVPKAAA